MSGDSGVPRMSMLFQATALTRADTSSGSYVRLFHGLYTDQLWAFGEEANMKGARSAAIIWSL